MTCTDFEKDILLAGSGELASVRLHALTAHLKQCPRCRAFQADMQTLRDAVHQGLPGMPAGPADPILQRIRVAAETRVLSRPNHPPRLVQRLLAMAAGLTLVLGTWFVATRPVANHTQADGHAARIAEWSSLLAVLMETEEPSAESENVMHSYSDLQSLARQLLILQDMGVDLPEDLADSATPTEASRPTTLQWHSTRAAIAQRCG